MCLCNIKYPIPTFPFPDVDECVLGTYVCDVNAYCENTIGSYDCVCVDGYRKNGTFCMSKCASLYHKTVTEKIDAILNFCLQM